MYYVFFLFYSIGCFVFIPRNKRLVFLFLISFGLIYFSSFRYETGVDYFNYLGLYNANYFASTEYAYWALSILHNYLFDSFPLFVFMISVITIVTKVYVLDRLSANIFISMYLFLCLSYIYVDMGFIRNSVSLAFFMLCFLMYTKNKRTIALLLFFISFLFHHSVIFMLYIFLINMKNNKQISCGYILLLFFFILISSFGFVKELALSLGGIPGLDYVSYKLAFYLNQDAFQNSNLNIYNIRFVVVALFVFGFRKRIKNQPIIKMYFVGVCLILLFGFNVQLYARIGLFVAFFEMLIMSFIAQLYKGKDRLKFIILLSIFYGISLLRTAYIMDIHLVRFL